MYLTSAVVDLATLVGRVQSPSRGGIACFVGTVRDHHGGRSVAKLDYSAYETMAEAECARIVGEAEARWSCAIALQHRTGTLQVGDTAVAIAAASAHRDEAFAACRYVIEELKRRVPIWKREYFADGTVEWVGGGAAGQRGRRRAGKPGSEGPSRGRRCNVMDPRIATVSAAPLPRGPAAPLIDRFERPLRSLRISVTDRCNMRCSYCMPEQEYVWLPRQAILTFEEIDRLVGIFSNLGVDKIRLTGGEPLLRHELSGLVALLRRRSALRDISLTTNGTLLARWADQLRSAGLDRVTVSLDTLRPDRMQEFARSSRHADVLAGISAARSAGLTPLKLNVVVIRDYNDDELFDLLEFARRNEAEVRFIEYMDVGGATAWSFQQVVSQREILERLSRRYGRIRSLDEPGSAPAERFALPDGTIFGVIASTTAPFCSTCDRSRLTADGRWLLCLYGESGLDLRAMLRDGSTDEEISRDISTAWQERADRGAEQRAESPDRGALYQLESLRADPHREMHTRGG